MVPALISLVAATLAFAIVVSAEPGPPATSKDYEALGLEVGEATEMDIQLAYKKQLTQHLAELQNNGTRGEPVGEALRSLIAVQQGYMALSDEEMRLEALGFVDYWGSVERLNSDAELAHFTEFQTGGSARLRLIYVFAKQDEKQFDVFSAAIQHFGRARVGQLCQSDAMKGGKPGRFIAGLRLFRTPAVVLFDPLSRASKVSYEVSRVAGDAEHLLNGHIPAAKMAQVQEFDEEAFSLYCGLGEDAASKCAFSFLLVTSSAFESKRSELTVALRVFSEACKSVQVEGTQYACFWLRLGRAPPWEVALQSRGLAADAEATVAVLRHQPLALAAAPPEKVHNVLEWSSETISKWLESAITDEAEGVLVTLASKPELPRAIRAEEEPALQGMQLLWSHIDDIADCVSSPDCLQSIADCAASPDCLAMVATEVRVQAEAAFKMVNAATNETKAVLAIGALISLVTMIFLCRICCCCCCCGKRQQVRKISEEQALEEVEFTVSVTLRRSGDEKFGMGIEPSDKGGLVITNVSDSGLLARWNHAEQRAERRIRAGDRIVAATHHTGGKAICVTKSSDMTKVFKNDHIDLCIATRRPDQELKRLVTVVKLVDLALKDCVELKVPEGGTGGLEVTKVGPALEAWNQQRRREGACSLQRIEVGDRIISVNSLVDVGEVRADTFELVVTKAAPEERLGMQVRQSLGNAAQMEVLEVLPEGAVARVIAAGGTKVCGGDRIVQANGKRGYQEMGQQLGSATLTLSFERWRLPAEDGDSPTIATPSAAAPQAPPAGPVPSERPAPPPVTPDLQTPMRPPQAMPVPSAVPAPRPVAPQPQQQRGIPAPPPLPPVSSKPQSGSSSASCIAILFLAIALVVARVLLGDDLPAATKVVVRSRLAPIPKAFISRIHPELYRDIAVAFLIVGGLLTLHFIAYEVAMIRNPRERKLLPQLCVASLASHLIGFGVFFLLVWSDVYF
eukprot:CAMPEP_0170572216 /NCGR_PEP_ID=MMETSP0224-20130122/2091_1 /TAXON_ID=285029 /ORGANISM="Togula jolla, Strain CCCM 725" /LENGTH=965 /DNA_ID=CAMNT_0010894677 /DNA_START=51 /DNA_END=2948 /DNA_ORIENTATION=+